MDVKKTIEAVKKAVNALPTTPSGVEQVVTSRSQFIDFTEGLVELVEKELFTNDELEAIYRALNSVFTPNMNEFDKLRKKVHEMLYNRQREGIRV